ncbi:MAG: shikimate kinase [Phycisphaerae bacterium]
MILALIGLRGSGKSTIGPRVARKLGWEFIDSDAQVVARAGCSIRALFERQGESAFRDLEAEVIAALPESERCVVALGGGALDRPETVARLRPVARFVWLRAAPETLARRISADPHSTEQRPPLTNLPPADELRALLARREPIFAALAELTIETDALSPDAATEQIVAWQRSKNRA